MKQFDENKHGGWFGRCLALALLAMLLTGSPAEWLYAQGYSILNAFLTGHILVGSAVGYPPPTVTNGTVVSGSTDAAGQIVLSGASIPVLSFGTPFNAAPFCFATDNGEAEGIKLAITKTTLTFTGFAGSDPISYACYGTVNN
jgi:hypothetical protein